MNIEDYFICPLCESKTKNAYENNTATLKCQNSNCANIWSAEYIRGFWAGYAKRGKELN